jgi:cell division protease FtsH
MGLENPIEEMQEDQRQQVAYHEAGHAVAQYYLRPDERIVRVSIIRRSEALGYVLPFPNYDIYALPLRVLVADILVSLAGHVAVKLFLGEYWTGATADFQNIRSRIWALASLGYFGPPVTDPGLLLQRDWKDTSVERFWKQAEESTERLLLQHMPEVEAIARALLEKGDLSGKECVEIMSNIANTAANAASSANGRDPEALIEGSEISGLEQPIPAEISEDNLVES